jgi:hypothetical protein
MAMSLFGAWEAEEQKQGVRPSVIPIKIDFSIHASAYECIRIRSSR